MTESSAGSTLTLKGEHITLAHAVKAVGLADTGGQAKLSCATGMSPSTVRSQRSRAASSVSATASGSREGRSGRSPVERRRLQRLRRIQRSNSPSGVHGTSRINLSTTGPAPFDLAAGADAGVARPAPTVARPRRQSVRSLARRSCARAGPGPDRLAGRPNDGELPGLVHHAVIPSSSASAARPWWRTASEPATGVRPSTSPINRCCWRSFSDWLGR